MNGKRSIVPKRKVGLYLTVDLYEWIRERAHQRHESMSEYLRQLLEHLRSMKRE